ncbi:protein disulfide-isomerase A3 [Lutzomyia longipalpis]|uniref:Protein disulfide-isomerase n=1 Tax=Lutzomyia longipalpis TaxID=7200 RepID=A0A7G3AXU9_LUTLO|nr:protein disulfide-isomerase A3 [Lutzomyia longipalpis]
MYCFIKIYMVALAIIGIALAGEQDVLELSDDDFSTRVAETETTLVMFYAPWCGHCKRLKPEYAKAAELLRDDDPPIVLAKIDCTEAGKETCGKYSVSGYPTLKIFRNGEVSQEYNGPREATGIVKYMRAQVGPASKELSSLENLESFLAVPEAAIVGFFEKETELKGIFLKYADKMREKLRFGHTSVPALLEKYGEKDAVFLFRASNLHNKFEESFLKFDGDDVGQLTHFVRKNLHGLVGHRTRDSVQEFHNPLIVAYFNVDYTKNAKGTNYWRNRVLKVAKEFLGKLTFAISAKDDFQHELNEYGYDYVGDKPLILARDGDNQKFIMKDEFSVENLHKFASDLLDGNLEPYIKSEAIPAKNDGPVKVAVAKNFDELVTKVEKDVLVEFYAPWCGHCKKLAPIYDELGEKLREESGVSIVKIDATANDVPPVFEVRGFPTIYWLPKNNKSKPVKYEGGRELEDFVKYIAKHATDELTGFDRSGNVKKTEL